MVFHDADNGPAARRKRAKHVAIGTEIPVGELDRGNWTIEIMVGGEMKIAQVAFVIGGAMLLRPIRDGEVDTRAPFMSVPTGRICKVVRGQQ